MKWLKIKANEVALEFRNNNLRSVLFEGNYWINPFSKVKILDVFKKVAIDVHYSLLLANDSFVNATQVIEVADNEIILQYEGNMLICVLTSGKHIFFKHYTNYSFVKIDLSKAYFNEEVDTKILNHALLQKYVSVIKIQPFEKAVLYINGKFEKIIEAGTYYFVQNSVTIEVQRVDMRNLPLEILGQEILTKDKAALRINFYLQYKIVDIIEAAVNNKEVEKQLYILMQLVLREYIGTLTLDELLDKKESVALYVTQNTKERLLQMGVGLINCGIKDIVLPGDMKEIMNQVLIAEKKAQANIIARREETASMRSMLNTAKLMEDNAMLFKLKEMEYVEKIAEKINNISLGNGGYVAQQLKELFVLNK